MSEWLKEHDWKSANAAEHVSDQCWRGQNLRRSAVPVSERLFRRIRSETGTPRRTPSSSPSLTLLEALRTHQPAKDDPQAGFRPEKADMTNPQKPFSESGTSPPLHLTVTSVRLTPGCTVALGEGLDVCGRVVSFAGDWPPMRQVAEALEGGKPVEVYVHEYQILPWRPS